MKISPFLPAVFAAAAAGAIAAQLAAPTAVHTKPDQGAPTITYLKAGATPVTAAGASAPAGWMAVELPGPFEGYVENKDLTKTLDVRPGAPIRFEPKPDAGILTTAAAADKTSITGIRGRWTQVSLERNVVGYIRVAETASRPAPVSTPNPPPPNPAPSPMAPPPVAPGVYGVATPGQPVSMVNLGDGGSSSLPRQYAGRFVSTRRPFTPRRPFDFALNDDAGRRFAYLDVSKLLLTDQIEKYLDLQVVVFGPARNSTDGRDIIIQVETLQLK